MELTMYDKLLQLPLFQGMSKFDFTDILEKVKIHFNKYEPGSCLVRQDTPCNQLIFVLDGEVGIYVIRKFFGIILKQISVSCSFHGFKVIK
jgi:CRP-like cAMP-binding protein